MRKLEIPAEILANMVQSGCTYKEIAEKYNSTSETVSNLCKRLGIKKPHGWRFGKSSDTINHPEIDKDWLIENWVNTEKSLKELGREFGINDSTLEYRVKKFGLSKRYKTVFNRKRFFDLTDSHIYYLAGLIATDGYVPKGKNCFEIYLVGDSERCLLESIRAYYEIQSKISSYKNVNAIRVSGESLNEFFMNNFGIVDGPKTFTVGIPKHFQNEDSAKAYILGCFDGDGSIQFSDHFTVSLLTASREFVAGIKQIIFNYSGIDLPMSIVKGKYYRISASHAKARRFLDWMYSSQVSFRLERKYNKYRNKVEDIV